MAEQRATAMALDSLVEMYLEAKQVVVDSGYDQEIGWQASLELDSVTEDTFLREAAWVVMSSGFRESVVRRCFASVSRAFFEWRSAAKIVANREDCRRRALAAFGSQRKVNAIVEIATYVAGAGIERVKAGIRCDGVSYLRTFPFIGPVTSFHLAKNLGLDVVKPDRHLIRMALLSGHESPLQMCSRVAGAVGDRVSVVDLVLWRYATLNSEYVNRFEAVGD